jgi:hypothetical protein
MWNELKDSSREKVMQSAKHGDWRYFLTGEEWWFYFAMDKDSTWVSEELRQLDLLK